MPLNLPVPQASLQSFFTEVQRYLFEELQKNTLSSADKRLPELINQISEMIATDCSNITAVRCLMDAIWELKSYAPQQGNTIYDMFSRYLSQFNGNDLTPLMIAIISQPLLVEPLLTAIPEELKSTVFQQVNKYGGNALMLAARYQPKVITPLLAAIPDYLKPIVFQQTTKLGKNALMLAARNQPAAIAPLLANMPVELKSLILQQRDEDGWNALMLAACNQADAIIPLLAAIPKELKPTLFQQITKNGWNALMLAAWNQPSTIEPLLAALPEEIKLCVFQQVNKSGNNALMLAAFHHPMALKRLLSAIPEELTLQMLQQLNNPNGNTLIINAYREAVTIVPKLVTRWITFTLSNASNVVRKKLFTEDDNVWFDANLTIMPYLFATQEFGVILDLVSSGVISTEGKTFKHIASKKQLLLDYILSLDEPSCYTLLKEIHDNEPNSGLAHVFHSKRGFLKPQTSKGILGQAEREYLRLHQDRMEQAIAEAARAPYLAVRESCDTAISSTAVIQQNMPLADSLYPILKDTTSSSNSSAPIVASHDAKPLLPDLLAIDKPLSRSCYAAKPLFYLDIPLKPSHHTSADFDAMMSLLPIIPTTPLNQTTRLIPNTSPTIDI